MFFKKFKINVNITFIKQSKYRTNQKSSSISVREILSLSFTHKGISSVNNLLSLEKAK